MVGGNTSYSFLRFPRSPPPCSVPGALQSRFCLRHAALFRNGGAGRKREGAGEAALPPRCPAGCGRHFAALQRVGERGSALGPGQGSGQQSLSQQSWGHRNTWARIRAGVGQGEPYTCVRHCSALPVFLSSPSPPPSGPPSFQCKLPGAVRQGYSLTQRP